MHISCDMSGIVVSLASQGDHVSHLFPLLLCYILFTICANLALNIKQISAAYK